jgi:hypothetical protein
MYPPTCIELASYDLFVGSVESLNTMCVNNRLSNYVSSIIYTYTPQASSHVHLAAVAALKKKEPD